MKRLREHSVTITVLGAIATTITLVFLAFNTFASKDSVNNLREDVKYIRDKIDVIHGIINAPF